MKTDPIREVLNLEAELVRLREARVRAERDGNALVEAAADHEQRQIDRHRRRILATLTPQLDKEMERMRPVADQRQ